MKNTMENKTKYAPDASYIRNKATISNGPLGLIAIKASGETILVNEHGIFGKDGKHIRTKEAKKLLGLA